MDSNFANRYGLTREQIVTPGWDQITWEIYVTTACNLRCTYCYTADRSSSAPIDPQYTIPELLSFFGKYARPGDYLSFIGGEPFVRAEWLSDVIEATQPFGFTYEAYSNGMNLSVISPELLNYFNTLLISIDGGEKENDRCRGKGTFAGILSTLESIRPKFNGKLVARMTVASDNKFDASFRQILKIPFFDRIYWQFQNTTGINGYPVERKWQEVRDILDLWLDHLRRGCILPVQTFCAMTHRLLQQQFPFRFDSINSIPDCTLACGAGHHYFQIFTNGEIYACPELVGQANNRVGNLWDGIQRRIELADFQNTAKCRRCEEFAICHCRCLHCTPDAYCTLIKRTIGELRHHLPEIVKQIESNAIRCQDFDVKDQLEEMF